MLKKAYRIIRTTAWILMAGSLVVMFSGIFMLNKKLGSGLGINFLRWHAEVAVMVFVPAFYLHSLSGLAVLSSRHKTLNKKWVQLLGGLVWTAFFVLFGLLFATR